MNGLIVKTYIMQVNPKLLLSLRNILNGSAEDDVNLIVHLEELKTKLLDLEENNEIGDFIKDVIKNIDKEVKYIWFYL